MNGSALYKEIKHSCNLSEKHKISFYMMNNFLYSRLESNYPTNTRFYDEDVNIYIANLLTSLSRPEYHDLVRKYVIPYDIVLNNRLERMESSRKKYTYYRANADFLLLSIGLFDNPRMRRPDSAPQMKLPSRSYIGRARIYYKLAFSHLCKASRRKTALADILEKLSVGLEHYLRVLSVMKVQYFNLQRCMSEGEIFHLERSVLDIDREKNLKQLHDRFLDIYSEYRRSDGPEIRDKLKKVVKKIQSLDPQFSFRID